jgi:hypothetical protein
VTQQARWFSCDNNLSLNWVDTEKPTFSEFNKSEFWSQLELAIQNTTDSSRLYPFIRKAFPIGWDTVIDYVWLSCMNVVFQNG